MKRSFLFAVRGDALLLAAATTLIAATYGLVRLAYGLFLPDIQAELVITASAAGLISSGASLFYCAGAVVGFVTASRHPRALVVAAALCAGVGAAGMAASPSAAVFAVFAVLGSAGAGLASPALVSIVRRNLTSDAEARGQAIVNAGTGPGLVTAGALALVLLPNWRLAWAVVAAFTLVVAALVLVSDRPGRAADHTGATGGERMLPPASWFRAHAVVLIAVLAMGVGNAAVWTYGRTLLADAGEPASVSVAAWIALGFGGTAVIATTRWTSVLHPRTIWIITVAATALATAMLGALPSLTATSLAACVVFGWGYTAGSGALISWTTGIDARRAPAGASLLFIALVLGQALGATLVGLLLTAAGAASAFLVAAVITAAAATVPLLRSTRAAR